MVYVYLKSDLCVVLIKFSFTISGGVNTEGTSFSKKLRGFFSPNNIQLKYEAWTTINFSKELFSLLKTPLHPLPHFFFIEAGSITCRNHTQHDQTNTDSSLRVVVFVGKRSQKN